MMGSFVNSGMPAKNFRITRRSPYFIDKSALIGELLSYMDTENRFLCFIRPRRFGKTVMANMVASFLGKASDTAQLFEGTEIFADIDHRHHLNKYNVIYIDFSNTPRDCTGYSAYINRIQNGINRDLARIYPQICIDISAAVWDVLEDIFEETGDTFVFVMDEWDAVFHMPFIKKEERESFLMFLKLLLKGKGYVSLAYMTGVLPIAKYSSGSELNMFVEYDMATKVRFSGYFGFNDSEVDRLYEAYLDRTPSPAFTRKDLSLWYDGYYTACGMKLYNPRSVICALTDNQIGSYWVSSGPYDEIFYYIKNDIDSVRDDLTLMVCGETVSIQFQAGAVAFRELDTRDLIFSAMVVYGLLTYVHGRVMIPNRELMKKYNELLLTNRGLGYIYNLARESERMLEATLSKDTDTMAEILEFVHNTESPVLSYNNETELSAVVNLAYLSARDRYRVEREDKAGKGFVDFIFYPEHRDDIAIILELKVDSGPDAAINQIRERDYKLRFSGKIGESPKYTGTILAVGIGYDRKSKKHSCIVQEL